MSDELFNKQLSAAVDACTDSLMYMQKSAIRQAFFAGVAWEMKRQRELLEKRKEHTFPSVPTSLGLRWATEHSDLVGWPPNPEEKS